MSFFSHYLILDCRRITYKIMARNSQKDKFSKLYDHTIRSGNLPLGRLGKLVSFPIKLEFTLGYEYGKIAGCVT